MSGTWRARLAIALAFGLLAGLAWVGSGQGGAEVIEVDLTEWSLGFATIEVPAGRLDLRVTSGGEVPHSFRIEWTVGRRTTYAVETPVLQPGQRSRLIVTLPAGTYKLSCPILGHDVLGMVAEMRVK